VAETIRNARHVHTTPGLQARGRRPVLRRVGTAVGRDPGPGRTSGHLPGAVALVARHGKVGWFEAFGKQDPASGAPMSKDAIFRIYSMTKALVSVAVMMLWEEGRLLLNDPIEKYLPAFASPKVGVVEGERCGRWRPTGRSRCRTCCAIPPA
jgi:CubicO group peptidase (beta-lactamase class C family)